ncbi:IS982 family transposase, partial [Thiotrichales bacterium 19S3-7]|nr:IS982 family transposase [Thiotrichales bacterium 19S3-7]MCF6803145.1 IS982 family transposase [Thiotrichales bacterium 19S3-11]
IILEKHLKANLIGKEKSTKGRKPILTVSEIATILVMFQQVKWRTFKDYYNDFVCVYWKNHFAKLPSYNRFVELIEQAMLPLSLFILANQGKQTGIYYIDSSKLPVCHNLRAKRHKVFSSIAEKGRTGMGYFYGLKLHLVVNQHCEIMNFQISKGNLHDSKPMVSLCDSLTGYLFGDKGYISKDKKKTLLEKGLEVMTKVRKNMKKPILTVEQKQLLNQRSIIGTLFDHLKNSLMLWHTRHRSVRNAMTHLLSALAAWVISPIKISAQKKIAYVKN